MIRRLISGATLFLTLFTQAQSLSEINWQDAQLGKCVMEQAAKNNWHNVSDVTRLKCHKKNIHFAAELEAFSGLEYLSLFNNKIERMNLRKLSNLTFLNLANNKLTSLQIDGLEKIETLYLFRNKLSTLNLSGLSAVTKVRLMQNQLIELDITPMKALETGYFFDNELTDLQITGLEKLTFLDVKQNPMPDELYDFYDEQEGVVISHDGNADDWQ